MAIQFRRILKMEKAARMEGQGLPDPDIAQHLGLTYAGLAQLKQDPDYGDVRRRILTGVCSHLDTELADDINYHKQRIKEMLPAALDGLYELAIQDNDKRLKLSACESILDREGKLAKVSRIGLPTEAQGGIGTPMDDDVANQLATVLLAAKQQQEKANNNVNATQNQPLASTKIQ